ncbi:hypothetical protein CUU66_22090 [Peribacillus deserti]|uniref:Uncharacterized protein n=1 Tax=Peribacillus deserti TaxID=673318 RepID=A0A2N5M0A7_9BACI|nr:hypothetical protein CUU66_22090 [Peribacillus deserti]
MHCVDWSGRCETPAGEACLGRPRSSGSDEEAHGPPAESERLQRKSTNKFNRVFLLIMAYVKIDFRNLIDKHVYTG